MKKISAMILAILLIGLCCSCEEEIEAPENSAAPETAFPSSTFSEEEKLLLSKGDVIKANSYTDLDGVEFLFDGTYFQITNTRENAVTIQANVYGAKADGTYQFLGCPAFYGIDWEQYEKDKSENGWAWEETTNEVSPGEVLCAAMTSFFSEMDVEEDGYYDISFVIHPEENDPWAENPESDVFKFPA